MEFGRRFFEAYALGARGLTIVEIGAQDVNGSLRNVAPPGNRYVGVDFVQGKGVDIVISDPYALPFDDNSVDVCVTSSCLEHSEFFWLVFNEILRTLKPGGLAYLNVPSNGTFHRYPVDCWRFYPDSGIALQNWGRRSGYRVALLESFIGMQREEEWNDFVGVFVKDEAHVRNYPKRMLDSLSTFANGLKYGEREFRNFIPASQDQDAHAKLKAIVQAMRRILNG